MFRLAPVSVSPTCFLDDWMVVTDPRKPENHHLLGMDPELDTSRISTAIVEYNPETKEATTKSGRKYTLRQRATAPTSRMIDLWRSWGPFLDPEALPVDCTDVC